MLSIVIPSLNEGPNAARTVRGIQRTIGLDEYEIILVDSGGTELDSVRGTPHVSVYETGRDGAPQARNFGAEKAQGDTLVFVDAHVDFEANWGPALEDDVRRVKGIVTPCVRVAGGTSAKGYGFRWKNLQMDLEWMEDTVHEMREVPFACACCLALRKDLFERIGAFDSGTRLWGSEDAEISMRAWLMGYDVVCDPALQVDHSFRDVHPYPVAWFDELYNKLRFGLSHFSHHRLEAFLYANAEVPQFVDALLGVCNTPIKERRTTLFKTRARTDDWFFEKFPMNGWNPPRRS